MFVLSNAWSAVTRHKARSILTALTTLLVTFGTATGLAVTHANRNAHGSDLDSQTATLSIRPTKETWAKVKVNDSSTTKYYMTWDSYTDYASVIQNNLSSSTLDFNVTATVPIRAGETKAVTGGDVDSMNDDKTGGKLLWRAFYTEDASKSNDLGTLNIVDGKDLDYDSTDTDATDVLVSKAYAEANDLKVGDTFKIAKATDTKSTVKMTVRGIYEYTSESTTDNPVNQARNRDNAIYSTYVFFSTAGMDPSSSDNPSGWAIPDLDVEFNVGNHSTYDTIVSEFASSSLPKDGYAVSSPSLNTYNALIEPLTKAASQVRTGVLVLLALGGILLLSLLLTAVFYHKRDAEIGMALSTGVSKGRLGRQFMVEVFIKTIPCFLIGLLAAFFAAKPIGAALTGGHSTPFSGSLLVKTLLWGLAIILVLAILAALRLSWFSTDKLFKAATWGDIADREITDTTATETATDQTDGKEERK